MVADDPDDKRNFVDHSEQWLCNKWNRIDKVAGDYVTKETVNTMVAGDSVTKENV